MRSELSQRLLGILAADAVGYSRLMSFDEQGTVAALEAAREAFRKYIEANRGRVVDMAGDSVLAVFETANGAVAAALAAQEQINTLAEKALEGRRLLFRIGLHLGDVIEKADGTVYGDGVNIAARLQGLAEPGGITVSDALRGAVRAKVVAAFDDQGEKTVKNMAEPVRTFGMRGIDARAPIAAESKGATATLAADGTAIAHAIVDMSAPVPGFSGRPAIAVLPFINMSGDPDQEFFADGLAEDILTRLAMGRWFPVIARNSSFTYKGRVVNAKEVGRELGARYLLEGSVRKAGNRIRVSAELIDATAGHHIWAAKYDRLLEDFFSVQDELTDGIVGALGGVVERAEIDRGRVKQPGNLDAWEVFWRGAWHQQKCTREGFASALPLFARAVQLDPTLAVAHSAVAWQKILEALFLWTDDPRESFAAAVVSARSALQADPLDSVAHSVMGNVLAYSGEYDEALALCRRGVELNPSNANGYGCLALPHLLRNELELAIKAAQAHIRKSPNDVWLQAPLGILAVSHYQARNYETALEISRLTIQRAPAYPPGWRTQSAALGQLGRLKEARQALGQFLAVLPGYTSERVARSMLPFRDEAVFQHFLEGLRKAGWEG